MECLPNPAPAEAAQVRLPQFLFMAVSCTFIHVVSTQINLLKL